MMKPIEVRDAEWDATFNELEEFATHHGRLPSQMGGPDQKRLYAWVGTQRAVFNEGKLRRKRFRRLSSIPGALEPTNGTMEDRLQELDTFFQEHGRLPRKSNQADEPELRLAGFLIHQLRPAIRNETLHDELLARAQQIPGVADIRLVLDQEMILEQLTRYAQEHGHLPPRSGGNSEEQRLAAWMANNSRGVAEAKTPNLRARHEAILALVERFPNKMAANFEQSLINAEEFVIKNGHRPSTGNAGANWLAGARKQLDDGTLSESQKDRLRAVLGAPSKLDYEWEQNFLQLRQYASSHDGRLPGTWGEGKVFSWLTVQRRQFRAGKLSAGRLAKLLTIEGVIPQTTGRAGGEYHG